MDNFENIYSQIENIPGWMGEKDCRALYDYVKDIKGLIVEIGPYMGRSTKLMALASNSKIIAIDSFIFVGDMKDIETKPKEAKKQFLENTAGLNITLVHANSRNVGKRWVEPIDFLHIDADHRYKAVKKDIDLFVPHVKSGSYVFLHDYVVSSSKNYGVKKAVEKSRHYFSEIKIVSGFACCRKK